MHVRLYAQGFLLINISVCICACCTQTSVCRTRLPSTSFAPTVRLAQHFNLTLHLRFRLCFYRVVYSTTCSTEIKPHISKCKAGWTGNFCHQACPNKLNVGEYYSESGSNAVCAVAQCTNAKNGQYYTGRGLSGRTSCPTAPCTNKPKAGLRFITNGGTSSTGCKIGGVYALSSALIYLLLTHACTTQFLRDVNVTILLCRPKILQRRRMDEDSGQSQHGHGVCSMQQRAVPRRGTH